MRYAAARHRTPELKKALESAQVLSAYALSGTELAYGAMRLLRDLRSGMHIASHVRSHVRLREEVACYGLAIQCHMEYAAMRCDARYWDGECC
eukprot:2587283-Rhodomonas_salina.3